MQNYDRSTPEAIRFYEHDLKLSNQGIIKFAYLTKDIIEIHLENKTKLCFEEANCYVSCYYVIRKILKCVDPRYLKAHRRLAEFYSEDRELSNDWDILHWDDEDLWLKSIRRDPNQINNYGQQV